MNTTPQNTPFKQTEIGPIPQDWEVKKLGEVGEFASGTTPRREMNERYFQNGSIFWVKTMDLNDAEIYDTSEKVTEIALKETSSLKVFPKDTVLVAMYGGYNQIGRTGILKISACVNQALTAIQVNKQVLNPLFLINILNYKVNYWKDVATSSRKDPNITSKDVKTFPIPLPPLPEQTAIATALSDADALIGSLEKLIHKKRLLKQATMQHLLTPKEDWEVKKLGEICEITAGGDLDRGNFSLIKDDKYCFPIYSNSLSEKGLYGYATNFFHCENTITVTARGTVGFANARDHKYSAIGRVLVLNPKEEIDCFFISEYINNNITFSNESTGVPQLTAPQISKHEIIIPPLAEQTRIATILSDMDAELSGLEGKLEKYRQLKQGMMQQLLTGKIRLV